MGKERNRERSLEERCCWQLGAGVTRRREWRGGSWEWGRGVCGMGGVASGGHAVYRLCLGIFFPVKKEGHSKCIVLNKWIINKSSVHNDARPPSSCSCSTLLSISMASTQAHVITCIRRPSSPAEFACPCAPPNNQLSYRASAPHLPDNNPARFQPSSTPPPPPPQHHSCAPTSRRNHSHHTARGSARASAAVTAASCSAKRGLRQLAAPRVLRSSTHPICPSSTSPQHLRGTSTSVSSASVCVGITVMRCVNTSCQHIRHVR